MREIEKDNLLYRKEVIFICDDNSIMEQVKGGNKKAFEELVLLYRKSAIGFAYRFIKDSYLAEDIVQESFASIYINRNRYKPKNSFKTFLFAIVRNRCIDFLRKNKDIISINYDDVDLISDELSPDLMLEHKQKLTYANKLLDKLKTDYRTAFYLYEYDGFSYKEIAEIMEKSLPQIKIIIYRARNKIQKYVKEDMQYEK
jgi:RNA polymerase sigma-70 factor (ECF subfamily)